MKKRISIILLLAMMSGIAFVQCSKDEDEGDAPQLPPMESLALDFTTFMENGETTLKKSTAEIGSAWNFGVAYLTVAV